jgi:hypothetical protein
VSTWEHAFLGGKVSSLGFPREGGKTPHACIQVDGEILHATIFVLLRFLPLQPGEGTSTPCYEVNRCFL